MNSVILIFACLVFVDRGGQCLRTSTLQGPYEAFEDNRPANPLISADLAISSWSDKQESIQNSLNPLSVLTALLLGVFPENAFNPCLSMAFQVGNPTRSCPVQLCAPEKTWNPQKSAILWDVDGTLVESTKLAFDATNEVLKDAGSKPCTIDEYLVGCKYTTPERFNFHLGLETGDPQGARLGQIFDETYVARVSTETAGLFEGLEGLLRSLAMYGHPQGALSNACGAYVRAVINANKLDEVPGQRVAIMNVALGADEVPKAKPDPDGLLICCRELGVEPGASVYVGDSPGDGAAAKAAGMRSVGVLWGANPREKMEGAFDVLAEDVRSLSKALQGFLLPPAS